MSRVLIGEFGQIVLLGLEDLLDGEEIYIVKEDHDDRQIPLDIVETEPDVVILDLDHGDGAATAQKTARSFPAITVIACSSVEPRMQVYPRFHNGEFYEAPFSPTEFLEAVKSKS